MSKYRDQNITTAHSLLNRLQIPLGMVRCYNKCILIFNKFLNVVTGSAG